MTDAPPLRIVVLGGGTAGWTAACLIAKAWPRARVTVVESPAVGIVGVGEGSTPQMRDLFRGLGIAEGDWMPAADATYKAGIRFDGWGGEGSYFHPFPSAIDRHTQAQFHHNTLARRRGADVDAHPDRFFLTARIAADARAPVTPATFPFDIGYGYHFDAHKVGQVLRDHAVGLGVVHLSRHVASIALADDGDVAALVLDDGERVAGDLFMDASGFRSLIAQQALGVRFRPFAENLFCDSAVTIPTPRPHPSAASPLPPSPTGRGKLEVHTTATALSNGWAWRIPLTSRTGNGYVYSSAHISPDAAETELRRHLNVVDDVPARHLSMKVGRVETTWTRNCVAIGLAQGFIEPLEATALHLTQVAVEGFVESYAAGGFTPAHRDAFNARIARRYEGVRDYIVAHYRLNRRGDTDFWRDNAANERLSDDLKAIMTAWFTGGDVAVLLGQRDLARYYSPMSWEVLFAGYGTFPDPGRLRATADAVDLPGIDRLLDGCVLNLPDHADALSALRSP
ncbi:tryptophan halogenase [Sphingomonas sp. Leaf412]|uniref:tryptophan halogenase family protein n=1 Tax=Sphingomonas sp. Leaf412 TaxID=1736370 RepID=UPI0006FA0642|nr:tryptophan halogenase family protein [Sphingomonas sp. Leaf412]KQT34747.1 tryptophan halogenase [Sphingomonas sp. Leaf412]